MLNTDARDFWKEIKKVTKKNKGNTLASTVDGKTGQTDVCAMWKDHFEKLLNTTEQDSNMNNREYFNRYECKGFEVFTQDELAAGIKSLKLGKAAGNDGLAAEAFKYADKRIVIYLSMLVNAMLCHGYLPIKLMDTIIVPIVKDMKGELGSKDNYRPIALTTIMSKLFESVILNRYEGLLLSEDSQFGFKKKHSTELCVYTLKQIIEFYRSKGSSVYVCFMDASKAFDRVNHTLLFRKMLERNMPNAIVRILHVWYACQQFYVKWGSEVSSFFLVTNGVRQGGILSPVLFNLYVNELSENLCSKAIGCHFNSVCYNHLMYADDTVLLAPSPKALQTLIDECISFADSHDLIFNKKKTKFMCIKPVTKKHLYVPKFYLRENVIQSVQQEEYLGYILNDDMRDDDHIIKEMRNVYARGNMLIRNFKHCTENVKVMLFKTYCSSLYCCPLWSKYRKATIKKLHVACNKMFKCFMNVPRDFSASLLFVSCNVENFTVLRRKLVYNLYRRVYSSSNTLVSNFSNCISNDHFRTSWTKLLRM